MAMNLVTSEQIQFSLLFLPLGDMKALLLPTYPPAFISPNYLSVKSPTLSVALAKCRVPAGQVSETVTRSVQSLTEEPAL